ncbi:MAG TPA: hypothetical protein VES20_01000 [Bryobacteraceae bacterium]|nr:hypothetical protein [Bryobacteraceae bacterium]
MSLSTSKKVTVQRFDREPIQGFISPGAWLTPNGAEVLTSAGNLHVVPYSEIRWVSFLREFGEDPSLHMRRSFVARPRVNGIWLKLLFRDQTVLEALIGNDLLQVEQYGLHVQPPDQALRIWVPRAALAAIQVLGVAGSPWRKRAEPTKDQGKLFE